MSTRAGSTDGRFWGDVDDDVALRRYRTLVNTIDDGMCQIDPEGYFVAVNDVIVETTGYSREELVGEHVSLVLAADDIERIEDAIDRRIEAEDANIATFELGVQTADGGAVPCELRLNPLFEAGEFRGTIGVARDLTEEKQRLATLESARASYDSITSVLDEANIGVFVLDDEFEVAWADETIGEYFGLDRDELVGRDKRRVVREDVRDSVDDPDRFAETVLATYDDNSYIEEFECRVTEGEGRTERWLEHWSKPIESGQYAGGRIELYYDISDRKRSEDALQDTEERFQSLVDAVEEYAIFRLDRDGRVISWNEGAKAIKGYGTDDILGEHFSTFYTEADRAANVPERNLERATETGSVEDEGWRVRGDGSRFWANVTITAIRDEDGTHRGFLKVTRDMTDRRARERELESELQRILGRISDAFYAIDEDFRFTHVNERARELLDHSEGDLLDEDHWDVFSAAESDEVRDAFRTAMDSQEATALEFYDESLGFWAEMNLYPSETGISVYFRDVTERKAREEKLERYERTIETIWDGVATLDADGRIVMINDAFCEMTGYERDELLGEHVTLLVDETVDERSRELQAAILADEQESASLEFEFETADGETVPAEARFGPYVLEDGSIGRTGVIRDISERKERERELKKYETIVETVNDGIYTVGEDGRFTMVNDAYCELTGYSRAELLGSRVSLVVDDEIAERANEVEGELIAGDVDEPVEEAVLRTAGGDRVAAEATFSMLPGDDRERIGVARDITERKERERELARFKRAVEASGHAIYMTDAGGTITYVNSAFEATTGYSASEAVGESPSILQSDEHDDAYYRDLWETVRAGEVWEEEITDRRKNGELYHAEQTIAPVTDEHGEIDRFVAVQNEITERKERERALEESERRYRTLVENFPNGAVGLYDSEFTYIVAGGELLDELEYAPDDIVGTSIYGRYPAELVDEIEPHFRAAFDGESNSFDIEFDDRSLLAHTLPVRNADDEIYAGMVLVQDVTERREYRRQLEESNERLEQFAYAASHDLQEPLRMVTSYLQLIESRYADELDEDGEEFLEFAVDGAERMREMIDALLEYSRVETRGDPFEPVDLNDVLDDVREDLQMRIEECDAEITTDDLPRVDGDASQLRQVFQNLLSNAVEYSGDRPPRVDVDAERDGNEWIVSVRDEGVGIDPDEQDRIFEVFQRLHTHDEHPGTGIGLALCRRIVERHGGEIWVDSEPGEGATFSFTLPVADARETSATHD